MCVYMCVCVVGVCVCARPTAVYWNCCHSRRNPCQLRHQHQLQLQLSSFAFAFVFSFFPQSSQLKRPKALRERQKCNKRQAKYLSNQFQCSTVFVSRPPKLNKLTRVAPAAAGEEEAAVGEVEPAPGQRESFADLLFYMQHFACANTHKHTHTHTRTHT